MSLDQNRPPYVMFEMRGVEDREASRVAGHTVEKELCFAIVTRPGSRDTFEQEAAPWLASLKIKEKAGQIPPTWYPAFEQSYKNFISGETGAVSGTPIKGWTGLGSAAQKTLIAAGILSVEDLAAVPDADLQNVGTGAMSFKQKAKAYLEAANGPGKVAEELATMRQQMLEMSELIRKQATEIEASRKTPAKV